MRVGREGRPAKQHRFKVAGEGRAAIGTSDDADEGDAHLHGAEEGLGVRQELQDGLGALFALVGQALDARGLHAHQRDLAERKETVQQGEQEDDEDLHGSGNGRIEGRQGAEELRPADVPVCTAQTNDHQFPRRIDIDELAQDALRVEVAFAGR